MDSAQDLYESPDLWACYLNGSHFLSSPPPTLTQMVKNPLHFPSTGVSPSNSFIYTRAGLALVQALAESSMNDFSFVLSIM